MRGHAEQVGPAGVVLDRDQRLDPPEHDGFYGPEVHRQDSLGLRGKNLPPARARPERGRIETGLVQNLPHGGGGDAMAEPDQFALHAPVSPLWVLGGHADDQFLDRCCGRRTSGLAARGVVPLPGDQPAMPGQNRGRSDRKDLCPAATGQQPGQGGQPQPVDGLLVHPGDLAAQYGVLVA